jgi:uncharacterized protein (DUF924 family)
MKADRLSSAEAIDRVLVFWFDEVPAEKWFARDAAVDAAVRERFAALHADLTQGVPVEWEATPDGCLAAVVVLDQFSRNLFRDDPRAFATDGQALALAERAIARGFDRALAKRRRQFLYLPFQHDEDANVQVRSLELYRALGDEKGLDFAERHKAIIDRFGRFPHRNAALGRASTPEERAFLEEPGSSF